MGRFIPPDHTKGDEATLGGYAAVHGRPPAFEGSDRISYSVELVVDETGDAAALVGGYLLFVRWRPGQPAIAGHIETDFLVTGASEDEVRGALGAMALTEVKRLLDEEIARRGQAGWGAPEK